MLISKLFLSSISDTSHLEVVQL